VVNSHYKGGSERIAVEGRTRIRRGPRAGLTNVSRTIAIISRNVVASGLWRWHPFWRTLGGT
jgi:hypothetical protein